MDNFKVILLNDYEVELEKYLEGDTIMLRVMRGGNPLYIAFEIE